jgi:tetratricopeptide (TPR) repeat protein
VSETPGAVTADFAGRYRIERELGHGATSIVHLALDVPHGRLVAIKMLRPELAESLSATRFLQEIRRTAQLQHPNIIRVLDSGEADGTLYCVFPYMREGTLRDRLSREKQLTLPDAIAIARTIADALGAAHAKGLIHRDVKPENILFAGGQACLADFGIARALVQASGDLMTSSGVVRGTPAYMSPEQASGDKELDGRSDIYSLACVAYEMIAGMPAFVGPTPQSIMSQRFAHAPRPMHVYRPTVPPELEAILEKAFALSPADRFQTVGEFSAALAGVETHLPQPGSSERVRRTPPMGRRARMQQWAAAGATVLAVAAALIVWRVSGVSAAPLDPNRVMVFPMSVTSGASLPRTVGEDAATMIGSALDGAGSLRWIDAWPLLAPVARDSMRAESEVSATKLARSRHCGRYVTGRIVASNDSMMVLLDLWDTDSAAVIAHGRAGGAGMDAWRLALRAVNEILPALIPGVTANAIAGWQDRNPTAIANFLLGEAAFRRAHFVESLEHYRKAVHADSLFALAAIRGAQAATWNHRPAEAAAFVQVATRAPLPPRYAHLARAYTHYLDGRADSAVAELQAALTADPQMAVAWAQLGEVYTHLLPSVGNPDSLADDAFGHALQLDKAGAYLLYHPIQIALRRGEVARATPMMRQFLAAKPETTLTRPVEIMRQCLDRKSSPVNWEELARNRPEPLVTAAFQLAAGGAQLACSASSFKAILAVDTAANNRDADGRRWVSLIGLQAILLAQNRSNEAARAIDAFDRRWHYGTSLFLLAGPIDSLMATRAREIARSDARKYGQFFERVPYAFRLWELGQFELYDGHVDVADTILKDLRARLAKSRAASDSILVRSLDTRLTLARGDTTKALSMLRDIVPAVFPTALIQWNEIAPVPGERLLLARLLLARGDPGGAVAVANVFDSPGASIHLLHLPASLTVRAQAATALDDERSQTRLVRRVASLRAE